MSDIVERLRDQGRDAFAKQYSLGMFKLCAEAADEIEGLRRDVFVLQQALYDEQDGITATLRADELERLQALAGVTGRSE
jgi:hypothetical protein